MKISQLLYQLHWVLQFGRPIKKISVEELYASPDIIRDPVFFLSTGRCGTEWFSYTLSKAKNTVVFHHPTPSLSIQNKFIYQLYERNVAGLIATEEVSKQLLLLAREQHFRYAYKSDKRYIETNNHITFFANALAKLFSSAKFIHLYRHPGDFVTSGMNRGWFAENIPATVKMIEPPRQEAWDNSTRIQKISWVWNETNAFIETFKQSYPGRVYSYDFTKRDTTELMALFDFLNIERDHKSLIKSLEIKKNIQKEIKFPKYQDWDTQDKKDLIKICGLLADQYQYKL